MANGLNGRRTMEEALTQRGERGVRVADFNYRKASLELGMLKGNAFVITLRLGTLISCRPTSLTPVAGMSALTRWTP